jgi:hypothetical protein
MSMLKYPGAAEVVQVSGVLAWPSLKLFKRLMKSVATQLAT